MADISNSEINERAKFLSKANMKIEKITNGAEYRMDEQF